MSGLNGYFPTPRMIYQQYAERIPDPAALHWLARHGVTALIYHKGMELKKDPFDLPALEASPLLEKTFDGPRTAVFRIR